MMKRIFRYVEQHRELLAIITIVFLAFFARVISLQHSNNPGGDPVSRIWHSWRWADDPHIITHGVWGPLHFYILGAVIKLTKDTVLAPVVSNILFSTLSLIPFWVFVGNEFGRRRAWLPALIFAFYPIAFRGSLTSMSEPPFIFFVCCSLAFLSHARERRGAYVPAILSGLCLTLSAMLRYESWILIPVLSLFLIQRPKALLLFLVISLLHPLVWMTGNFIHHGNALHSVAFAGHWQIDIAGINDNLTRGDYIGRFLFPVSILAAGLGPCVFPFSVAGMIDSYRNGKQRLAWLAPALLLLGVYTFKVMDGSMFRDPRYYTLPALFVIPFAAIPFKYLADSLPRAASLLVAVAAVSTGFFFGYTDIGSVPAVSWQLTRIIPSHRFFEIRPIPAQNKRHEQVLQLIAPTLADLQEPALISDFFGWHETFHLGLHTRLHPDSILIAPGAKRQKLNVQHMTAFLSKHLSGILILKEESPFSELFEWSSSRMARFSESGQVLALNKICTIHGLTAYRYETDGVQRIRETDD